MKITKKFALTVFICLSLLLTFYGCGDIADSYKPGSFGKTPRETAMVEAITEKHGDLTEKGDPRFLEARMTTDIEDFIPVDTVTKYSEDAVKLYVWFVYDNFDNDEIEVEFIYTDDNYSIHTFKAKTGSDLGRAVFSLERPDDGWAAGNYKVIIRGRGVTETLTFEIIKGDTVALAIPFENGKIELKSPPGWYFTHWEFMKASIDITEVGGRQSHVLGTSTIIWDYLEGTGDKNDFTVKGWRTYDDGSLVAAGDSHTVWTDPPAFFSGTDLPVINVKRESESDWGRGKFSATFDIPDHTSPTGITSGAIVFISVDENEQNYVQRFEGEMRLQKPLKGSPGMKKAIMVSMGDGYGFKYHYEWRDS